MSYKRARELDEQHAELVTEAKKIREETDGKLSPEQSERFDNLMDEAAEKRREAESIRAREDRLNEAAEYQERDVERRVREGTIDRETAANLRDMDPEERNQREKEVFIKRLRGEALSEEDRAFFYPARSQYPDGSEMRAAQQSSTAGAGGQFIPEGFRREIVEAMKAFGGLENRATVITTDSGNNLPVPTVDDTANSGSIVGEASTIGSVSKIDTSNVTLEAAKYQSGPVKLSLELEQDSAFDMESFIREKLGIRLGRVFASHLAARSSTESTGPHGLINASTGAVSIVQGTTTLTPAKLRDLIHAVDPAYRGRAAFIMNDESLKNFAKLEDADGRPLWQPSLQSGVPDEILGFPVQIDQNMPSMSSTETSATKPVFFGDLSRYYVRRVRPITMFRLNERFIEEGNFGFIAFMRGDGRPVLGTTAPAQKPIRAILATTS